MARYCGPGIPANIEAQQAPVEAPADEALFAVPAEVPKVKKRRAAAKKAPAKKPVAKKKPVRRKNK